MTKNKVHVKIGGASYTIVTEDEAEYVEALADEISENMRAIINSNPSLSMTQAAVLVALDNADASKKATASADNLRAQIKDILRTAQGQEWRLTLQDVRLSVLTVKSPI